MDRNAGALREDLKAEEPRRIAEDMLRIVRTDGVKFEGVREFTNKTQEIMRGKESNLGRFWVEKRTVHKFCRNLRKGR